MPRNAAASFSRTYRCAPFARWFGVLPSRVATRPAIRSASNPLDECLFIQAGEGRTLFTKQANKGVCHRIAHGLDAFLKPSKLALNMRQFLVCVCRILLCASHGLPISMHTCGSRPTVPTVCDSNHRILLWRG